MKKDMVMRNIPINNPDILDALNKFLWYYDNKDVVKKQLRLHGDPKDRSHFVGAKYRDEIIAQDERHEGFPDSVHSYSLKSDRLDCPNASIAAEFISRYSELNVNLCHLLSTRNNALTQIYPPNGYISWHNNANASAYNIIFSWSETGEGNFRYVDGHTGKEVVMQDVKGWQCKVGYFGAYGEPWYNRVYHAAETDCWRITVSYIFDRTDMSSGLQDDVLEEIMSDY
jgi:hypothetical protein